MPALGIPYTYLYCMAKGNNQVCSKPLNKAMFNSRSMIRRLYGVLLDFSLTVKAATLIFKSGRGSAILSH